MCLNHTTGRIHVLVWLNTSYSKDQNRPLCLCCRCSVVLECWETLCLWGEGGRETGVGHCCRRTRSRALTTQKPVSGRQGLEKNQVYSKMEDREGCHPWCPVQGESWVQRGLSWGKGRVEQGGWVFVTPGGVSLSPLF